jgi:protein KRI1
MSSKKKVLFDDEPNEGGRGEREPTLKLNEKYAKQFEKSKQKQELQRLRSKYADVDDDDDADESSSTTEDSDAELDTPAKDAAFLRMLPLLVTKDPALMQSNERVFDVDDDDDDDDANKTRTHDTLAKKPLSVADFRRQTLLERGPEAFANADDEDDAAAAAAALPYAHEQEELKRAFTEAAAAAAPGDDDDDDEGSGGGLRVKQRAPALKPNKNDVDTRLAKSARGPTEMSKVREFWTAGTTDEGERFLRDFIVNQRWKGGSGGQALGLGADGGDDDEGSDVLGEDQLSLAKRFGDVDSEDESEVERQDEFEHRYNFRFEEPGGTRLLSHPRSSNIESARRKDTRGAERRQRRAARKAAQREEINAETRRLKALARQQLSAKVDKLRKVAALERKAIEKARAAAADDGDELAHVETFTEDDLDGDWDPEAHDRRMAQLFGDTFYNKLRADKKKPKFDVGDDDDDELKELLKEAAGFDEKPKDRAELPPSEDDEAQEDQQQEQADDDDEQSAASGEAAATADTSTSAGKKRKVPEAGAITAMRSRLERQVEQDLGDYHDLDYEDVVAGEIKTRFRYIEVEPVSADMDELEILRTPDAAMAQLLPLKKLAPYRDARKLKKANWPWLKRNWMTAMRAARAEREKEREELRADRRAASRSRRANKKAKKSKSDSAAGDDK